ncbi:MAG: amidoligase family protein, partial [Pseudomonadota bacterium]
STRSDHNKAQFAAGTWHRCARSMGMTDAPTFDPLPTRHDASGAPRRVGVEVEFGGLPEHKAAKIIGQVTGGYVKAPAPGSWEVETPCFGRCQVYLDTHFRDDVKRVADKGVAHLARLVVPVKLVTDPFDPAGLPAFDTVLGALRDAGAIGSRQGLLLGFAVHLNIEIDAPAPAHLWRIVTAYALIESELRRLARVDISRRVLTLAQPYPKGLVDDLARVEPRNHDDLIETYLSYAPTPNHGLDMLPVFAQLAPDKVHGRLTDSTKIKARPAYHFRMPDCRIDEPGWSIAEPWSMWLAVERIATSPTLFGRLRRSRAAWSDGPALQRGRWSTRVRQILDQTPAEGSARRPVP